MKTQTLVAAFAILVAGTTSSQPERAPGEYLVTLAAPAEANAIADVYGRFGIRDITRLGNNVFLVRLREDPGPTAMETLRASNARIAAVEPNLVVRSQKK